ncbi:MAG: cytochrome b N-terminal domain-containing protein, partial [Planctomycetales bacterium]|nr:cytochrome b N-terminal domain-containing protein [Planctomycetales bacterium]
SPSAQTAWESVYYIQNEMHYGSVVRGIHHYSSAIMVVLLAIHLIQVIIDGAYKAPREINFWLGLILMQIVLALSLTGYLLPWDQKGYYATQVTTKIVGASPVVGPQLQELVQGGPKYGHHTLTRFFAMHAGVLPGLLVAFLGLHIYVFRRHGIHVPDEDRGPTQRFWPDQILKDAVACLGVLAVILMCAIFKGAELSAPADPSEAYSAARPEWYFLFLFRFLRFEAVEHFGLAFGAIYVPGIIMGVIALMPIIAMIKGGHRFNVLFMWTLAICVIGLTGLAVIEDSRDSDHQAAIAEAERDAHRVKELAGLPDMIPVEGAGSLLKNDPFTQGPRLFAKHCSSCHRYNGHNGRGRLVTDMDPATEKSFVSSPTASDLGNFATRDWWRSVLSDFENHMKPATNSGYDLEASAGDGMVMWCSDNAEVLKDPQNKDDVDAMIEYLASLSGNPQLELDGDKLARGEEIISGGELTSGSISSCTDCHAGIGSDFELGAENGGYPELNQYGSVAWLKAFIQHPESEQFYGERNVMVSYAEKLSEHELDMLARWLAGDYAESHVHDYPSKLDELDAAIKSSSNADGASENDASGDEADGDESGGEAPEE